MKSKTQQNGNDRVRCVVYTRKSTSEGLDQEFNSLHAQREACEAFILSQRELGWKVLPETYEIGYSVRDNDGILVARNDVEVDCGSGYFKRYSIEVPLLQ